MSFCPCFVSSIFNRAKQAVVFRCVLCDADPHASSPPSRSLSSSTPFALCASLLPLLVWIMTSREAHGGSGSNHRARVPTPAVIRGASRSGGVPADENTRPSHGGGASSSSSGKGKAKAKSKGKRPARLSERTSSPAPLKKRVFNGSHHTRASKVRTSQIVARQRVYN